MSDKKSKREHEKSLEKLTDEIIKGLRPASDISAADINILIRKDNKSIRKHNKTVIYYKIFGPIVFLSAIYMNVNTFSNVFNLPSNFLILKIILAMLNSYAILGCFYCIYSVFFKMHKIKELTELDETKEALLDSNSKDK